MGEMSRRVVGPAPAPRYKRRPAATLTALPGTPRTAGTSGDQGLRDCSPRSRQASAPGACSLATGEARLSIVFERSGPGPASRTPIAVLELAALPAASDSCQ